MDAEKARSIQQQRLAEKSERNSDNSDVEWITNETTNKYDLVCCDNHQGGCVPVIHWGYYISLFINFIDCLIMNPYKMNKY